MFLTILTALSAIYVGTSFGGANEAEMPKYSIGDWWKFNVDYKQDIGLLGNATYEVVSDSCEITQFGSTYMCYEFNITGSGTIYGQLYGEAITGTWTMDGKIYALKLDLSDVKNKMTIDAVSTYASTSMTIEQVTETTYNPPLESHKGYPIAAGESWSAASTKTTTSKTIMNGFVDEQTNTTTSTTNWFILRTESTTVSAGEFDTFVITTIGPDGSYTESWFSPEVGFAVKEMIYSATGKLEVVMELLKYNYTAAKGELLWLGIITGGVIVTAGGIVYVLYIRRKPPDATAPSTSPME